jgi:hypothetical protein
VSLSSNSNERPAVHVNQCGHIQECETVELGRGRGRAGPKADAAGPDADVVVGQSADLLDRAAADLDGEGMCAGGDAAAGTGAPAGPKAISARAATDKAGRVRWQRFLGGLLRHYNHAVA